MAGGDLLGFPYDSCQALVGWSLESWRVFDGWATGQGTDLLNLSCRRFLNQIFRYLTKDLDDEGIEKFEMRLEQIQYEAEALKARKARNAAAAAVAKDNAARADSTPPTPGKVGTSRWVMPEGWTPPGWNEEKSMQAAMGFMGFKANPK